MKYIIYLSLLSILLLISCKKEKETIQLTEEQGQELIKVVTEKDWGGIKNEILLAIDIYEGLLECGISGDSSGISISHMTDSLSYAKKFNYNWEYYPCNDDIPIPIPEFNISFRLNNADFENENFSYLGNNDGTYSISIYDDIDPNYYGLSFGVGISGRYERSEFTNSYVLINLSCPMSIDDYFILINRDTKILEDHLCPASIQFPTIDNRFSYKYDSKIN